MSKNESGAASTSTLVAVVMTVLFVGSLIFGLSMLVGKADLQKNLDKKVQQQLSVEVKKVEDKKDAELAEKEKSPTKTYTGPSAYGSLALSYPKTYSAYVDESTGTTAVNGYFHPNVVPKDDRNVSFALRVQLLNASYDSQVKSYDTVVKTNKATVKAFRADKVNNVLGVRIDGEVSSGKQGVVILLPLRDKTIKIWTENKDYIADFNTYVIPSITFVP